MCYPNRAHRRKSIRRMASWCGVAAATAGAQAQQEAVSLPEVVVSASGLPLTESALTQHVQVFTRAQIEAAAPMSVSDFLARAAGVPVDRLGRNGGYGSLFLRGADPSHVVVLVDGVRQNDPLSTRGSAVDLNALAIGDIERIEVVRGNASVVHGEALAGVVQLFTRARALSMGRVDVAVGEYGLRAASASVRLEGWRISANQREDGDTDSGQVRNAVADVGWSGRAGTAWLQADLRAGTAVSRAFPDDSGGQKYAVVRQLEEVDTNHAQGALQMRYALSPFDLLEAQVAVVRRTTKQETPGVAPGLRDPAGLPEIDGETNYRRNELRLRWIGQGQTWEACVSSEYAQERGALHSTLFVGFPLLAAGLATACFASLSVASLSMSLVMASRRGTVEYLGFRVCFPRSTPLPTLLVGRKMAAPCFWIALATLLIGASKATASATTPPMDVPQVRSKRWPIGTPMWLSMACGALSANRPR